MRIETKQIEIYDMNDVENNDGLKELVLEKHRYINVDCYEWYHFTFEYWTEKLKSMGFNDPDIEFSGFYSQGDGASFTCKSIDIKKVAETSGLFSQREINVLYALWNSGYIEAYIKRTNHHYCHERSTTCYIDGGGMPVSWKHIQRIVDRLATFLTDFIVELNCEIYQDLKNEYEYLTSDVAILDTLAANDYEFDGYGNIA